MERQELSGLKQTFYFGITLRIMFFIINFVIFSVGNINPQIVMLLGGVMIFILASTSISEYKLYLEIHEHTHGTATFLTLGYFLIGFLRVFYDGFKLRFNPWTDIALIVFSSLTLIGVFICLLKKNEL